MPETLEIDSSRLQHSINCSQFLAKIARSLFSIAAPGGLTGNDRRMTLDSNHRFARNTRYVWQ
ncbi:hypothetical protein BCY88_35275 [Paraburkholderia fungorum]|uniref:Uncharacterized protein n=1 Tax=Paraburkholderia fungorum TaxID=134537 RepID=A0A420FUR0_9BURK|nr:hypothetical protein BCY88_35275 [Paraburkholderia fungorum]